MRLPAKEAALLELLREQPSTLADLRALPLVRRKIGVGYLSPILRCLLDENRIACTNGIFWVRADGPGQQFGCSGCRRRIATPGLCARCYGAFR